MEPSNDEIVILSKTKRRKNFLWSVKPEWIAYLLYVMCNYVDANLKSAQDFKDAVYQGAAQKMKEKFGVNVTGEQCKNQIRHQRSIWSRIQELKKKSGVSWDEQKKMILMGYDEYTSHIQSFPKDAAYLNIFIVNYEELEKVCGEGHATGDWAKASNSNISFRVQQMCLNNDTFLSLLDSDVYYSNSIPENSNVDTSKSLPINSDIPEISMSNKDSTSVSKATTSKKRVRETERTLRDYVAVVADSVMKIANAIENQVANRAAQERKLFTELIMELEKMSGFTEEEIDLIYDILSAQPNKIQAFLSRPKEWKARWMRKKLIKELF